MAENLEAAASIAVRKQAMAHSLSKTPPAGQRLTWRRRFVRLLKVAFIVLLPIVLAPLLLIIFDGLMAKADHADVIVVPGAALKDGGRGLSNALEWRMETAVQLYHQGFAPWLYLSGGGEGAWREAGAMAQWAVERGVPRERIILDYEGHSTRATAHNLKSEMAGRGWKRAIAVSQWYHVARLRMALRQESAETAGCPCAHPRYLTKEPWFTLRELPALYLYALRLD